MERGFDKLITPTGLPLVVLALFLFFVFVAVGGVFWKLYERESRRKRGE